VSLAHLVFSRPPSTGKPVHLVFGETDIPDVALSFDGDLPGFELVARVSIPREVTVSVDLPPFDLYANVGRQVRAWFDGDLPSLDLYANVGRPYALTIDADLPGFELAVRLAKPFELTFDADLPALVLEVSAHFDLNVSRPTVAQSSGRHQQGQPRHASGVHPQAQALRTHAGAQAPHSLAERLQAGVHSGARGLAPARSAEQHLHQTAESRRAGAGSGFADMLSRRVAVAPSHQAGVAVSLTALAPWQERMRRRVAERHTHAGAIGRRVQALQSQQDARRLRTNELHPYQGAVRPRPGRWAPTPPPVADRCYIPSPHLVFEHAPGDAHLVFICERHNPDPGAVRTIVIPVREVYMVVNELTLNRISDGQPVPVESASIALDVDSWAWDFSATVPGSALALVQGNQELLAGINGMSFYVIAEEVISDRRFGSHKLQVRGRGRSAVLADPYAPVKSFRNTEARTAEQLMAEVLTNNGVSLGWTVDWRLTDWLVPAEAFSTQGSYMDALTTIAAAAGGYVQPHETAKELLVLPRYPALPRDWAGLTPDVELPADLVTVEGIRSVRRPSYNRAFAGGGQIGGLMVQATLAGTDGGLAAPMVIDPLITHVDAGRQRARAILGNTGAQDLVQLQVPALRDLGLVRPGKLVRYVDGATTRLGLVRNVGLSASFGQAWQTFEVETHGS